VTVILCVLGAVIELPLLGKHRDFRFLLPPGHSWAGGHQRRDGDGPGFGVPPHQAAAHPVHIVVEPKEHIPSLVDLGDNNEDLLLEVMNAVREVAEMVRAEHGAVSMITCARCPAMRYADSARALLEQAAESGPAS
jgi:hypothetical protein